MQIKKTVEATMNIELLVVNNKVTEEIELETYNDYGSKISFSGYDITEYLKQLPFGKYELTITAKLIED